MDLRHSNGNRPYPTISGDPSTDFALWGLAAALWEMAKKAVTKESSTSQVSSESRACAERINQTIATPAERERLLLKPAEIVGMLGVSKGKVTASRN